MDRLEAGAVAGPRGSMSLYREAVDASPTLRSARRRVAAILAGITLAWVAAAILLADPRAVGLFHDDGLYVLGGQSIARGEGYRIVSLPGEPWQTKYPFLFSVLLAGIWKLAPEFPGNARWLQGIEILSGALLIPLTYCFARRRLALGSGLALGCAVLVASSPALFGVISWVLTELPFAVVALTALLIEEERTGAAEPPILRSALAGGLAAAGYLLKSQGLVLGVALVAAAFSRRQWRRAFVLLACFAPGPAAWWFFRFTHASEPGSWIFRYYVTYDYFLPHWTREGVAILQAILPVNLAGAGAALCRLAPLGGSEPGLWRAAGLAVALSGSLILAWRRGARASAIFFVLMVASTVTVPWNPLRLLVPVLPLVVVLLVLLSAAGTRRLAAAWAAGDEKLARRARALVFVAIGVATAANALVLAGQVASDRADDLPAYVDLRDSQHGWRGFAETIAWIRANTGEGDLVASAIDPFYYLHTGRRGLHYWRFNSPTYFYPDRSRAQFVIGSPSEVVPELRRLGVRWLLRDPALDGLFAEGRAADELAREIVASDLVRATLVFRSSDFEHFLYRLDWPRDGFSLHGEVANAAASVITRETVPSGSR